MHILLKFIKICTKTPHPPHKHHAKKRANAQVHGTAVDVLTNKMSRFNAWKVH